MKSSHHAICRILVRSARRAATIATIRSVGMPQHVITEYIYMCALYTTHVQMSIYVYLLYMYVARRIGYFIIMLDIFFSLFISLSGLLFLTLHKLCLWNDIYSYASNYVFIRVCVCVWTRVKCVVWCVSWSCTIETAKHIFIHKTIVSMI